LPEGQKFHFAKAKFRTPEGVFHIREADISLQYRLKRY